MPTCLLVYLFPCIPIMNDMPMEHNTNTTATPPHAGRGFEDLKAWQLARRLMNECHKMADALPGDERFDLVQQIRRSSKSVMANIAEGYGRYHYLDSLRFHYAARGSLNETINHLISAHDLGYIDDALFLELYDLGRETERTLNGYISYLRRQKAGAEAYGHKHIRDEDDELAYFTE
jgi:four helix bundle protein